MISTQASTARTLTRSSGRWARDSGPGPVAGRCRNSRSGEICALAIGRERAEFGRLVAGLSHSAKRVDGQRMCSVQFHPGTPGRQAIVAFDIHAVPTRQIRSDERSQIPVEVLFARAGECAHADGELRVPRELAETFTAPEMLAGDDCRTVGIGPVRQRLGRKPSSIRCCRRQAMPTACSPRERPSDAWPPGARTRMTANAAPRVAIGRRS